MAVYILNNRKIVDHRGKRADSFSNDRHSIPNFRIAGRDFEDYQETPEAARKKKDDTNRNILKPAPFPEDDLLGTLNMKPVTIRDIYTAPMVQNNIFQNLNGMDRNLITNRTKNNKKNIHNHLLVKALIKT
ncbi:hypothetical protein [Chryseobacterium hagamense]|uniref:Uncharacterized protein n=1 Tax=Chryseobacterium hagamense TaxID=395935 RepID=A0A511YMT2_9FLAO|nr:hypothetical protein [Chryseobacterium hagamense]GEN76512.1 hypothetical protein CHA01nite_22520 [Chryseobacterium hagamense]